MNTLRFDKPVAPISTKVLWAMELCFQSRTYYDNKQPLHLDERDLCSFIPVAIATLLQESRKIKTFRLEFFSLFEDFNSFINVQRCRQVMQCKNCLYHFLLGFPGCENFLIPTTLYISFPLDYCYLGLDFNPCFNSRDYIQQNFRVGKKFTSEYSDLSAIPQVCLIYFAWWRNQY